MAQTIFQVENIKIIQSGYLMKNHPTKLKQDNIWWQIYVNDKFTKGFYSESGHNAGDAFQFALNLAGIGCD